MKIQSEKFILKNGKNCLIYSPTEEDAQSLAEHKNIVRFETNFLMKDSFSKQFTTENEKIVIQKDLSSPYHVYIVAKVDGKIVGFCGGSRKNADQRMVHRFEIAISVQKDYWGLGIGSKLMQKAIACAKDAGFEQVELAVAAENAPALHLYEKFGFKKYGTFPHSMKLADGTYSSAYFMLLDLKGSIKI